MLLLSAGPVCAQDGLRSPVLPEHTIQAPLPPAAPDIFRVSPEFYTQPRPPVQPPVGMGPYWPWWWTGVRSGDGMWRRNPAQVARQLERDGLDRLTAPVPPVNPIPPYQPGVAGPPRTLYVVPGCYAGDRPPDPAQLSAACREAGVRVIPPS